MIGIKSKNKLLLLIIGLTLLLFICCSKNNIAKGVLEISYDLNECEGIVPSYQIAIWLKNEDTIKTLFVSEYLSYGGYNDTTICPSWSNKADWDNVSEYEFETVTSATPPINENVLKIDCKENGILAEKYNYCIQVHIIEEFNVLALGEIQIGDKNFKNMAELLHFPSKHPVAFDILSNVSANYVIKP